MPYLAEETLRFLKSNDLETQDIQFVTDGRAWFSFEDFIKAASSVFYDDGYGRQEINCKLKIVGINWWLERSEYDGAEKWVLKRIPIKSNFYRDNNFRLWEDEDY